jgi:hypothetical protein
MRTERCHHCKDTYTFDDYGPIKECSCRKINRQEAIEIAAREWCLQWSWNDPREEDARDAFIAGVKWAEERGRK